MNYSRADKSSARHRMIAIVFTVLFHLGLLGTIYFGVEAILPSVVKEWLNIQPDNELPAKRESV
jgi:hypothetical protein